MKLGKGFTMVELLVVLIILGILVAVAVPMYFANTERARASEAVAAMGTLRQALRDYNVSHNTYFDIAASATGNIQNALPASVAAGVPTPATAGVGVNVGVAQYFSNASFSADATAPASARFTNPAPVDFLITVDGSASQACVGAGANNCAVHNAEVTNYRLEMDNSGRVFVSYNSGTNWGAW
jgi:prepilin-type N-terminal cleavage/methylation domain-containing protein